jgi:hypothetical protein
MAQVTGADPAAPPPSGAGLGAPLESEPITLVTGLPRSGTSMAMQMLAAGGCPPLADGSRGPDVGNAWGYLEYAPVRRLHAERGWLHLARGRALKVVAPLLPLLSLTAADGSALRYRAIVMHRDWADIAASQRRLLALLGRAHLAEPEPLLARGFQRDLEAARWWLERHAIPSIDIDYRRTLDDPVTTAERLAALVPRLCVQGARAAVRNL